MLEKYEVGGDGGVYTEFISNVHKITAIMYFVISVHYVDLDW